jgi:hypothetical protein
MTLDPTLRIALEVLQPYLDDIVIAGGWVPYLYAAYLPPSEETVGLKTRDLDLAVPREVPERDKTIDQLLNEADFTCEFRSLGTPPVTMYLATHAGDEVPVRRRTPLASMRCCTSDPARRTPDSTTTSSDSTPGRSCRCCWT